VVNNVLSSICYAAATLLLRHFGPSHSLTRTEISAKSNHSRTSEKFSRKSNYSRTYAKTGGWGPAKQMIFSTDPLRLSSPGDFNRLENSAPICRLSAVNCKRAFLSPAFTTTLINIVGAPTFVTLLTAKGKPKKKRPLTAASGHYIGKPRSTGPSRLPSESKASRGRKEFWEILFFGGRECRS